MNSKNSKYILILDDLGTKVKTAEALMHGKNIVGTTEAFVGYDLDFQKVELYVTQRKNLLNSLILDHQIILMGLTIIPGISLNQNILLMQH